MSHMILRLGLFRYFDFLLLKYWLLGPSLLIDSRLIVTLYLADVIEVDKFVAHLLHENVQVIERTIVVFDPLLFMGLEQLNFQFLESFGHTELLVNLLLDFVRYD